MSSHSCSRETLLCSLDPSRGLSTQEAAARLAQYGPNCLQEKNKRSLLRRFLDQFRDAMILILIAAALVSFVIACMEGKPQEFFEPALILLIVIVNAIMGVMQEGNLI